MKDLNNEIDALYGIKIILEDLGENPNREGLRETPSRVLKSLREMTRGYKMSPLTALGTVFNENSDEMIVLRNISFTSLCEHHLLPFSGEVSIGYLPRKGKILGLSKLARVVEVFSARLQVQERMTQEIAHTIHGFSNPLGVGVIVRAHHHCMSCRGVKQQNTEMVTSCLTGYFKKTHVKSEFLGLCH